MGFDSNQRERFLPLCPDFVVEVRSKNDSLRILNAKMQTWLDNGAKLAWMFDPYEAKVTIYRPNHKPEVLQRPDVVEGEGPVAGFRLTTAKLWAESQD